MDFQKAIKLPKKTCSNDNVSIKETIRKKKQRN